MSVVVWGIGKGGERARQVLEWFGYEIAAFCDGKSTDKEFHGYEVLTPQQMQVLVISKEIEFIVIGVFDQNYENEIRNQLNKLINNIQVKTMREILDIYIKAYVRDQKNMLFNTDCDNEIREHLYKLINEAPVKMKTELFDTYKKTYVEEYKNNMVFKWDVEFERQSQEWIDNLDSEVEFWLNEVAKETGYYHQGWHKRINNNRFLNLDYDCEYIARQLKENDIVIDVGCGMISLYGNELENSEKIKLMAVDPLAHYYNLINEKYIGEKKKEIKFGLFEFLANFYPENYADYIIINNALDHCIDPYKSIIDCIYVLKKGGTLHLRHRQSEAVFEDWNGLHKWNIDYNKNEELIIWNRENAVNISQSLKDIVDVNVKHFDDERAKCKIIATITKKKEFNICDYYSWEEESKACFLLMDKLMKKLVSDSSEKIFGM